MKKVFIPLLCLLFGIFQMSAQNHRVVSNTDQQITFTVTTGDLTTSVVTVEEGQFTRLHIDGCVPTLNNIGDPELPMMTKTIEIPLCGDVHVTATAGRTRTLTAAEAGITHTLYPTQPLYHKSYMGDRTFMMKEATYATDGAYGMPLATVSKSGIARDVNMADVTICPVQVNPVTNAVTIYDDITITVTYDNVDMEATRELKSKFASSEFGRPSTLINRIESEVTREAISTRPVKMLIIANDMFNGQLDSLANWKRRKGFIVEIAYTGTIGTTTTAIKNYITSHFTNATDANPAPTYVLLVGDQAQLPTYSGQSLNSHVTDLYYFTQVGSDNMPDCYWGRFSAQSVAQLTPQIEKTLKYEQLTMSDLSYLDRCVLVAGTDGGSSGDYGYSHANPAMHYFEDTYSSDFFTTTDSYYNPHASSDASNIRTKLSNGTGYANYSAHCSASGWGDPSFSTSHVPSMTNTEKFGLMVGNCCQSNKFEESECFGEALLRANNKGAVGYIGGTDYTYWYHDYYWAVGARSNLSSNCSNCNMTTYQANNLGAYDRMCHTHGETFPDWYVTQGSINYAGNMAVQAAYGANDNYVKYYWEIYELMGDPSVMTWLGQPADMTITVDNIAPINQVIEVIDGTTSIEVSTGAPYTYVALTQNLNLITATMTDINGNCTLTFPAMAAGDTYELAASAHNYSTTFTTINVLAGEGARVTITDVGVTNDEQAVANANLTLDVTIENRFPDAATNTVITANTTSDQITLTDASETVGTVNSGDLQVLTASFALNVSDAIADGDIAPIEFTVSYLSNGTAETTTYTYNLMLVDAFLAYVSDSHTIVGGNNDNIIDPGETVSITIIDENTGHATAQNVMSELSTYYYLTPVTSGSVNIGTLTEQTQCTSTFTVNIGNDVPNGTMVPFFHHIYSTTNAALTRVDTIWITVGNVTATETWETGDMSQFDWTPSSSYPWTVVNSGAYNGTYCAKSGNYNVNNSTSELVLTIDAPVAGDVSYYSKVSSENYYDYFRFYLDGTMMEERCGNGSWALSTWPIEAGEHTLRFTYEKDYSQKSGSDCAWIDNISFPGAAEIAPVPEGIVITSAGLNANSNGYEMEDVTFDATIANNSVGDIADITLTMTTESDALTLTDATETIATIASGETLNLSSIFAASIAAVADGHVANCTITADYLLSGTPTQQTYSFGFPIHSAILQDMSHSIAIVSGNEDEEINPGETIEIVVTTDNTGVTAISGVSSELTTTSPYATITNATQTISNISANGTATTTYTVNIDAATPDNTPIQFTHTAAEAIHGSTTLSFSINVLEVADADLNDISHNETIISGNNDNTINPGETVRVTINTRNDGRADANNAISELTTDSPFATISDGTQNIGTIASNATVNSQFDIAISDSTPDNTVITLVHTMYSDMDTCTLTFDLTVTEYVGTVNLTDNNHTISIVSGNGDNNINPGETINVTVNSSNIGDATATNLTSTLTTTSSYAQIATPVVTFAEAEPNEVLTSQYEVSISANTPHNTSIAFNHLITDGTSSANRNFNILVIANNDGINENSLTTIALYPNPTDATVTVTIGDGINATHIRLFNTFGQLISTTDVKGSETVLDLSQLPSGIYFVQISNFHELITTGKVIKK